MEFAGRDGIGFLSKRGFYFFDGQNFEHISLKIDNLLTNKTAIVSAFQPMKRQLYLFHNDYGPATPSVFVANLLFVNSPDDVVFTEWSLRMQHALMTDLTQDSGEFIFVWPYLSSDYPAYMAKLEGNSGDYTHVDYKYRLGDWAYDAFVAAVRSKFFYLFDSEVLDCDIYVSHPLGDSLELPPDLRLRVYANPTNILGTPPNPTVTKTGVDTGFLRMPVGLHGHTFMFELYDYNSSSDMVFERLIFRFNKHGHRRV